jgi:hypothetical protein
MTDRKLCFVCEQWRAPDEGPRTCGPDCMEDDYPKETGE